MPFVEVHRVKEVKFRPRAMTTWKHKDHDFNEIDYQMTRPQSRGLGAISEHVVDDLSHHSNSDIENDVSDLEEENGDWCTTRSGSAASSKASESQSLSGNNNEKLVSFWC